MIAKVIDKLTAAGLRLTLKGDGMVLTGRKPAPELVALVRQHKVALLSHLNASKPPKPWKDVAEMQLLYPDGRIFAVSDDDQPADSQATHYRVSPKEGWVGIPPVPKLDPTQS